DRAKQGCRNLSDADQRDGGIGKRVLFRNGIRSFALSAKRVGRWDRIRPRRRCAISPQYIGAVHALERTSGLCGLQSQTVFIRLLLINQPRAPRRLARDGVAEEARSFASISVYPTAFRIHMRNG